jgi:glyoxylase-like metal-dependent hydrolase (beta-lactamase superfamily II)
VTDAATMPTAWRVLADGVYAWIADPAVRGASNAGVVVDDDGITVIDTLMVRSQWEPFAAAVAELGGRVRRVVLTHHHLEQVGGTVAFPIAAVYGSLETSRMLDRDPPCPLSDATARFPDLATALAEVAELGIRPVTHEVEGHARLSGRLEVLPAAGHTAGDLVVLVADADLCFAGGLADFAGAPDLADADVDQWIAVLDVVADLAATVVPALGPPGDADDVRRLQERLRAARGG